MQVLITPSPFKECLDSKDVAQYLALGFKKNNPKNFKIIKLPLSDGGRGSSQRILDKNKGQKIFYQTRSPLGQKIKSFLVKQAGSKKIFIESSTTCGIHLVPKSKRHPLKTSSAGLGDLIKKALQHNPSEIVIFLGDNYVNDCGLGMLATLGVTFFDKNNSILTPKIKNLRKISHFNCDEFNNLIKKTKFTIACNTTTYLNGKKSFIKKYSADKNIKSYDKKILSSGIKNFTKILNNYFNINFLKQGGCGSSGGLGLAFLSFFKSELISGAAFMCKILEVEKYLKISDIIITGEGSYDKNSQNKIVGFLGNIAKKYNKNLFIVAGYKKTSPQNKKEKVYPLVNKNQIDFGIKNVKKLLIKKGECLAKYLT